MATILDEATIARDANRRIRRSGNIAGWGFAGGERAEAEKRPVSPEQIRRWPERRSAPSAPAPPAG
jgi:hypothetical protein